VGDVVEATARAKAIADSNGGYVANLDAVGEDAPTSATMVLRIPANRLESVSAALKHLALRVTRETVSLEDVTAQAVDLDARLRTLKATETELLGVLSETRQRGGKADDIMSVYRELTGMRSQIEQLQGQRDLLANQVALATVNLRLVTDRAAERLAFGPWRPLDTLRRSFRTLVLMLRGLVDLTIYLVVAVAPVALVVVVPAVLITRAVRRRRTRA
jgi:hypothetical protein